MDDQTRAEKRTEELAEIFPDEIYRELHPDIPTNPKLETKSI